GLLGHHAERAVAQPLGELRDLVGCALRVLADHRRAVFIEGASGPAKHLAERGDFARRAIALLLEKRRGTLAHRTDHLAAHLFGVLDRPAAVGLAARHALRGTGRRGAGGVGSTPLRERAGSELFRVSDRASSGCPKSAENQPEISASRNSLHDFGVTRL